VGVTPVLRPTRRSSGVTLQVDALELDEEATLEKKEAGFDPAVLHSGQADLARDLELVVDLSGLSCRIGSSLLYADFTPDARTRSGSPVNSYSNRKIDVQMSASSESDIQGQK